MFDATRLVFYYAVTPVHMGAGSAIGAIDNPIQREVHTQHPSFAGAGLKGALRHHFNRAWPGEQDKKSDGLIGRIFGPETNPDFAGALSLSDAQLVALPVRSLKGAYVYATCPLALARVKRLAELAKVETKWPVPEVADGEAQIATERCLSQDRLILEAFEFKRAADDCATIADWLAGHVFSVADDFFAKKLRSDLVILNDSDFSHFARHAMVVEPHVRIDDESGTADDGGLFYTENLPPETIMAGLAQATLERRKKDSDRRQDELDAGAVLGTVFEGREGRPGIGGKPLQIGGDATTGRGLVLVQTLGKGA
ncbi:type III-B CRISPR module RAMP protein Cmr4 [uncultured Thiodictyon sp.]|uniref:type III-B CRISPR module RAMP protein Cmr4 n=1 Tax=uncultured Thiodictyon sp. TaxID=1846217 RepID=UPI0025EE7259|nr:type III-B CRISPR module RAMP protein Cmr4 [uncultured Thiodictyon sp.]